MKAGVARALDEILAPPLDLVPATATELFTMLSVAPEARSKVLAQVTESDGRMDELRGRAAARLAGADLAPADRGDVFALLQSLGAAGGQMLGVARLAADGAVGKYPQVSLSCARTLVAVSELTVASLRGVRKPRKVERAAADANALVAEMVLQGRVVIAHELPAAHPLRALRIQTTMLGLEHAASELHRCIAQVGVIAYRNA